MCFAEFEPQNPFREDCSLGGHQWFKKEHNCWVLWPKIRVSARWDHAARARACQDEGAPSREGQKIGTGVPCHVALGGRAMWHGRATCCFAASSAWRLGFGLEVFSLRRLGFFQGGEKPTFQTLYKGGQA